MKAVITFLAVSTVLSMCYAILREEHFTEELLKKTKQWHDACLVSSGTHEETIEEMRHGKFPEDPQLKQYIYCMGRYVGSVDKNGNLNVTSIESLEPPKWREGTGKALHETAAKCEAQSKNVSNIKDRLYKIVQCYYAAGPEHFFFP